MTMVRFTLGKPCSVYQLTLLILICAVAKAQDRMLICDGQIDLIGTGASGAAGKVDALGHSFARWRNSMGRNVNYQFTSMSSRFALQQLMKNKTLDRKPLLFAITSIRLDKKEAKEYPHLRMFPIMAWPMVIPFNIPGVRNLVVKVEMLSRIYMGKIRYWDHPLVKQLNPGTKLPHKRIIPIASAGDSGDAKMMTEAFSSIDPLWRRKYGVFTDPKFVGGICCKSTTWPRGIVNLFGKRSIGMMGLVASIPYTIGYIASSLTTELDIPYASLQNSMGFRVGPNKEGIQAAVDYSKKLNPDSLTFTLTNAQAKKAYPLVGYNYFVLNVSTTPGVTCCQMQELAGLVEWTLKQSSKFFDGQGAIAVTEHVADTVIRIILGDIRCDGQNTYVSFKKSLEKASALENWKLAVIAASATLVAAIVAFATYCICMNKYSKAYKITWIIPGHEINRNKMGSGSGSGSGSVSMRSLSGVRAEYNNTPIMLCEVSAPPPTQWQKKTKREFTRMLKLVNHNLVLQIEGVTYMDATTMVVAEYPGKGTLRMTLRTSKFDLHQDFKMALSVNLLQGLSYLHSKNVTHGILNSETCYVDSSWTLKIGQWCDLMICKNECPEVLLDMCNGDFDKMTEEEIVRVFFQDPRAFRGEFDKSGDIFSLGLLIFDIFTFTKDTSLKTPEMVEILKDKMRKGTSELPTATVDYPRSIEFLVRMCLGEPSSRPSIDVMTNEVKKLSTTNKGIVDMLMETMENYSAKLEQTVEERTTELAKKSNALEAVTHKEDGGRKHISRISSSGDLLHEVLPPQIATKLLAGEPVDPQSFECVTIYFSDIVGFTKISSMSQPAEVMTFLNDLWNLFDSLIVRYDVYKVDTIGDAYMVCSGLPETNGNLHAREIAMLALEVLRSCQQFRFKHLLNERLQIRIGINSGAVTTGVVGSKMPQYCVFGEAVNTASYLEATAEVMKIQVSDSTRAILATHFPQFSLTYRGKMEQEVRCHRWSMCIAYVPKPMVTPDSYFSTTSLCRRTGSTASR